MSTPQGQQCTNVGTMASSSQQNQVAANVFPFLSRGPLGSLFQWHPDFWSLQSYQRETWGFNEVIAHF